MVAICCLATPLEEFIQRLKWKETIKALDLDHSGELTELELPGGRTEPVEENGP